VVIERLFRGRLAGAALTFALLAGCGGGQSHGTIPAPLPTPVSGNSPSATLRLVFGGLNATPQSVGRRPQFVSPSSEGVLAAVFVHGSSVLAAASATDVSPGSAACGGSTASNRSCTVTVPAPAGGDDFTFTTYDAAPSVAGVGGSFPSTAHALGIGKLQDQTITAGQANLLTVYLSGVIAGIGSTTAYASLPADGSAHHFAFVIAPVDFDDNPIAAGSSDPYSNPISVTLAEAGGSGHATLVLNGVTAGAAAVLHASSDALQLVYDGNGAPGYGITVSLNATGASTQQVAVSPLFVASTSPFFSNRVLAFSTASSGQQATLQLTELNAPAGIAYAAVASPACANVTSLGTVSGGGASAAVTATAGTTIGGTGCTIALSDSLGTTLAVAASLSTSTIGTITIPSPAIAEYAVPTASSAPASIVAGPDGALWFTEAQGNKIGRVTTGGSFIEYALPSGWIFDGAQQGISVAPDGSLWFSGFLNIGRITTAGSVSTLAVGTSMWIGPFTPGNWGAGSQIFDTAMPVAVAFGSDGGAWFAQSGADAIGRMTIGGTQSAPYFIPSIWLPWYQNTHNTTYYSSGSVEPWGLTAGPDGAIWFTEFAGSKIGRVTTDGSFTEYALPTPSAQPDWIVAGPDGNLWFTEYGGNQIGKITTGGAITEYPLPAAGSGPTGIAAGPDGALWFTEGSGNKIGRITTAGALAEYAIPTASSGPSGIAAGPDGNIWFTELSSGKIGRLTLGSSSSSSSRRR
jgi:virginiamycin B lyase